MRYPLSGPSRCRLRVNGLHRLVLRNLGRRLLLVQRHGHWSIVRVRGRLLELLLVEVLNFVQERFDVTGSRFWGALSQLLLHFFRLGFLLLLFSVILDVVVNTMTRTDCGGKANSSRNELGWHGGMGIEGNGCADTAD